MQDIFFACVLLRVHLLYLKYLTTEEIFMNECEITITEQKKLLDAIEAATMVYTAPLISLTEDAKKPELGSGTFATIANIKGILTAAHVAKIFIDKKQSYVRMLNTTGVPSLLRVEWFIQLPPLQPGQGIDLAFIILHPSAYEVIESLGKKFWNIDLSARNFRPIDVKEVRGSIWTINGVKYEGKKMIDNKPAPPHKAIAFETGINIIIPNVVDVSSCEYDLGHMKFTVPVDYITCYLQTKAKIPKSFYGVSGGPLWEVTMDGNSVKNIALHGVGTEYGPENKAEFLKCRGPISLYQSFYPFCLGMLYADLLSRLKAKSTD